MNTFLGDCRSFADVYVVYIVIHSRTLEDYQEHVGLVFQKLRNEKLNAKLKKCFFVQ